MNQIDGKSRLWFPASFTIHHRKAILKHLEEGPWTLSRTEWEWALKGFSLLHNAQAETPDGWRRFAFLYETQIEAPYADRYLVDPAPEMFRPRASLCGLVMHGQLAHGGTKQAKIGNSAWMGNCY